MALRVTDDKRSGERARIHDPVRIEAEALADQVFIVDRGRVAISGTVRQLTKSGGSLESVFLTHTRARAAS